ncbi:M48 family metallopeptidase [Pontibacter sp. JH31]|uniref:M48 family metallopeptidase n=1 Tax=Pontibacter aquaedesilientis TaxID=2766980 RepID=A0ABR7XHY1_9BACT|nr:M48 family metallopeptidase [Pontibacter aquaedesilientis]MBD1397908.1 M48 family metallopeptidase [Pontibacter aquaedesilientis]
MTFEGKYYNGRSSKGMPAQITLRPDGLRIDYCADEVTDTVHWETAGIHQSEFNDATTLLRYGKFPQQSISVVDKGFREALLQCYRGAAFLKSGYNSMLRLWASGIAVMALSLLGLLVAFIVWGVPALADRVALYFPQQYERQLGQQLYTQLLQGYQVDDAKTAALNGYLSELDTDLDYPIKAAVVKSDEVNAFAIPGGYMVVYEGIIDKMEHHEELAALVGHELAHIQNRHSLRALTRSLSYYMLASVLFGDISGVAAVLVDNASALRNLEYNRSLELEADREGLELLRRNELNLQGAVLLMERLDFGSESDMLAFVSTHPNTGDRIKVLNELIGDRKQPYKKNPGLERHWESLKGRNKTKGSDTLEQNQTR